jgi:hypothetical protein
MAEQPQRRATQNEGERRVRLHACETGHAVEGSALQPPASEHQAANDNGNTAHRRRQPFDYIVKV